MAKTLRPDIVAAKKYLGFMSWRSWREVNKLEGYLRRGENVSAIVGGKFGKGYGILVLTEQRIIFLKDGWLGKTLQDFALQRIDSVEWRSGLFHGTIMIFGAGVEEQLERVWAFTGNKVVKMIQDQSGRQPDPYYAQNPNLIAQNNQANPPHPTAPVYQQPAAPAPAAYAPAPTPAAPSAAAAPAGDALQIMTEKLQRLAVVAKTHDLPADQVARLRAKILAEYEQSSSV